MVHPERFELPTAWFVAKYSIQLSYGCKTEMRILRISLPLVKQNLIFSLTRNIDGGE